VYSNHKAFLRSSEKASRSLALVRLGLARGSRTYHLLLEPLLGRVVGKKKTLAHRNASSAFNVLLGAGLVLVPHVHDCCRLTSIRLHAEETLEVLLDLSSDAAHSPLLAGAIFARDALWLHAEGLQKLFGYIRCLQRLALLAALRSRTEFGQQLEAALVERVRR